MHELGPTNGQLTVMTSRAGLAAKAGHDLIIDVTRWSATLELSPDAPDRSQLRATVDATSLSVRDGTGGVKPLTDSDRTEILKNINQKILMTDRYPEITFESTSVYLAPTGTWHMQGDLTLVGTTAPVHVPIEVESDQTTLKATVTFDQSAFGIKPYSGLMGALKVADSVQLVGEAHVS